MKQKLSLTIFLSLFIFNALVQAQNVNLNNQSGFTVVNKLPTINHPMPQLTRVDPWITKVYTEVYGRQPNAWEYNIYNYNNGQWQNYEQLKGFISMYQAYLIAEKIEIRTAGYNGNILVGFFKNGKQYGANVVAPGGANVVASGGANVVAAGGANVVAAGGANVVAAGGANLLASKSMMAVRPGR